MSPCLLLYCQPVCFAATNDPLGGLGQSHIDVMLLAAILLRCQLPLSVVRVRKSQKYGPGGAASRAQSCVLKVMQIKIESFRQLSLSH